MDSLQTQITGLSRKVDALYQIIEQLSLKVSGVLSAINQGSDSSGGLSKSAVGNGYSLYQNGNGSGGVELHKDVLSDSGYLETGSQNSDKELTSEVQIQRLTAQLTAAYNRIAALEEQLLSRRVH